MTDLPIQALLGAVLATAVAAVVRRRRLLSRDGAIVAAGMGTIVVAGGGWWWGILLIAFFATASAFSHLRSTSKLEQIVARGHERDAVQVLANGGIASALAALGLVTATALDPLRFAAFCGTIAAVNADTWGTELGRLSRSAPRLITTGQPVAPGVSGGITAVGTAASGLGGALIGALAAVGVAAGWAPGTPGPLLIATSVAGLAGSLVDSLLGATVQASYVCPTCRQPTEQPVHRCGSTTILQRGRPWITNDVVNVAASLAGAALAGGLWLLMR